MFANVILTLILKFSISQIVSFFLKNLIIGSLKLNIFLQCLTYELRYRCLNSDKFVNKNWNPPSGNKSKFNYFHVKLTI